MRHSFWKYGLALWLVFAVMACTTTREGQIFQDVNPNDVEVGVIEDSLLAIEIAYVGAIGHSYIFECAIENFGSETIYIDKSQFKLISGNLIRESIREGEIIQQLKKDKKELKKRKKGSTVINGIIVGLGVLAGATQGWNAGEVIAYNADPIIAIFDERRWYQRNIESVEDEVLYLNEAQFDWVAIPPGQMDTRDLLFPTAKIREDVDIIFTYEDLEYVITFPKKIFR